MWSRGNLKAPLVVHYIEEDAEILLISVVLHAISVFTPVSPMKNSFLIVLGLILSIPVMVVGQTNIGYRLNDSIQVTENGVQLPFPFAGGFNSVQFSEIDLDHDNMMDLFIYERNGNVIKTFLNKGTTNQINYVHAPEYQNDFPKEIYGFALLRDYNCDGKPDLFTNATAGFAVYRNDSDTSLVFTKVTPVHILTDYGTGVSQAYVIPEDVAGIEDMDGDGDLDILSFGPGIFESAIMYHENKSMDDFGHCDSLKFEIGVSCWGNVRESPSDFSIVLNQQCKGNAPGGIRAHPGSTILPIDLDADGDKEVILADVSFPYTQVLWNSGDQYTAAVAQVDSGFPANTTPIYLNFFPGTYYVDINNDGVKDLLASPNTFTASESLENMWLYTNSGANNLPTFNFQKKRFLSEDMIDLGAGAYPMFMDVDGDGLTDLLVGNHTYYSNIGNDSSSIAYFRNTGTSTLPAYDLVTRDYMNMNSFALNSLFPTSGDLDGDGDMDLIIGEESGKLHYLENTAGAGNPANYPNITAPNYMDIDAGDYSTPFLADLNRDSLLDLIVGNRDGLLKYYMNKGTATAPFFSKLPTKDTLGGINTTPQFMNEGFSSAILTDQFDSTGNYYLLVSGVDGKLMVYNDIDSNIVGNYTKVDSIVTTGYRTSAAVIDLDNDTILDIAIGEYSGGFQLLTQKIKIEVNTPEIPLPVSNLNLFPNPAGEYITVAFDNPSQQRIDLSLLDIVGRQVGPGRNQTFSEGHNEWRMNVSHLSRGVYLIRVEAGGKVTALKFVKS